MHTVHVRVNDAATGRPTPVRIQFTGPDGQYLTPFGRLTKFATGPHEDVGGNLKLGAEKYGYIDGTCEIELPAGPVGVAISKGPEYQTIEEQVNLGAGQLTLRFDLERWIDLRREGWYSADTRAHSLTPHAALLEAAAEDLAIVNLLAVPYPSWHRLDDLKTRKKPVFTGPYQAISNILAFSGQRPALDMPGHMVVVNTLNSHPVLGSLSLLNCHRVVYPLTFGKRSDNWSLDDWCDQCHRKGGLVIWADTNPVDGERPADLILGKIDALETQRWVPFLWYTLLSCGFHVPLVGGSGKESNAMLLGSPRTYARLAPGEELGYQSWVEAVRAGRTFVTSGPLLSFTVNGQEAGSVIEISSPDEKVHVSAQARSRVPFQRLEVVVNGVLAARAKGPSSAVLEAEVSVPEGGWLAARCQVGLAHTSPVYVRVADKQPRPRADAVAALLDQLDRMLNWAQNQARCETDRQRQHLVDIFQNARTELRQRAGLP